MGLRGYQALYGDWKALLAIRWIREAGVKDRAGLIRHLEAKDPNHLYLTQRYRANEIRFGFRNWYTWNLEHYGTSREAECVKLAEASAERLVYRFKAFETPPLPWLELLRSSYPTVRIVLRHRNPWKLAMSAG